jgi:hypothetical protein
MMPIHRHRVYGLTVESWIHFPELEHAPAGGPTDAVFRLGEVPEELPDCRQRGARYQAAPGRLLVWLDKVARYFAIEGREIVIQPAEGVTEDDLRLFLLCSPMGALLLQRGLLPLHASAIATPMGAVIFMGLPRAGKSTIAACFRRRGFRVLADDISVIRFGSDGVPWVTPGFPQFKLWPDALEQLGRDGMAMPRLRPQVEKRIMPFPDEFHPQPLPLTRIYLLGSQARPEVELAHLTGMEKVPRLLENTYRAQFIPGLGLTATHFHAISKLADTIPLSCVSRAEKGGPDEVADRIVADCGAQPIS